ncbi:hypothetical protein ONS95_002522 [Cadophora gregata]|uniref:uncharacterized protein n=1 Tax=Cadophora gregata TaxID=51156 RepID=UPI0026DC3B21|nr:uncharacterized protein ONS95_002522 [Cadophora gregata]KAK0109852.1 hypothetical protein ONS95_002522 [Cadophora gregata]KAK0110522.1 hypothetical protein ONS96_002130 [Cadophora gregata f. sp. sojae]
MDSNGATSPANTRAQPSIRSFFQPRQPSYTPPPGSAVTKLPASNSSHITSQTPPTLTPPVSSNTSNPTSSPTSISTKPSTLPSQATISPIQQPHIQPLRRINALLLPISYPDSFYHKILAPDPPTPSPPRGFSRTILWTDPTSQETKVVGGVVCRVDPALSSSSTAQQPIYTPDAHDIYIQSLCLLSPYRGKGLVAAVLDEVIEAAVKQDELRIESLYAHVWTQNEEALDWYAARGFRREEPVLHGYYRRLNPDTAYIFRRRLVPSDHLNGQVQIQSQAQSQFHKENVRPSSTPASLQPTPATSGRPPIPGHARSFQDKGPEREWNDLPEDVLLKPPSTLTSREGSAASSRSSSRSGLEGKGKKKRVYPAAAFGT